MFIMNHCKVQCLVFGVVFLLRTLPSAGGFSCNSGGWSFHIIDEYVCDGINDCNDATASDECDCPNSAKNVCKNGRCILNSNICDGVDDCEDGSMSDEKICLKFGSVPYQIPCSRRDAVRCADQTTCVKASQLCDGNEDCPDGSDEVFVGPGLKCVVKSYRAVTCNLPQVNVFDDVAQCFNNVDLCFDSNGKIAESCFQCLDGKHVISEYQVCDDILDCSDFSDECLCESVKTPHVCQALYSTVVNPHLHFSEIKSFADTQEGERNPWYPNVPIECGDHTFIRSESLCNGHFDCETGIDEEFCYSGSNLVNFLETSKANNNASLQIFTKNATTIGHNTTTCKLISSCLSGSDICNGRKDSDIVCPGGRISEEDCPKRFCCESGSVISIDISQVCDKIINCDDGSDESKDRLCSDGRFYCETRPTEKLTYNNPIFVPSSLVFNGRRECADGSDECPVSLDNDTYSSRHEMVSSKFLKAALWIIGPISFFGNIYVLITTVKKLQSKNTMNLIAKSHHIMIANLSVADGLMGLYLIMLCTATCVFTEDFCKNNNYWRTSTWCQIMGSLVVLSSEASVFILMLMGAFRCYTILRPFESQFSRETFKYTLIGLGLSWLIGISLAFFPWVLEFFTTHYFYASPFFPTDVVEQSKFEQFVKKLEVSAQIREVAKFDQPKIRQMNVSREGVVNITQFTSNLFPNIEPIGKFGFFSQNSICLPSFFTRPDQPGWQYSLAIVTLNFVSFLVMVIFYALIWQLSNSKRHINGRSRTVSQSGQGTKMNHQKCQLQKRVARLLLTDFVCWIPVCILSYVHFSGVDIGQSANAVSGIILLPINSALNPILYAGICDDLWFKIQAKFSKSKLPLNSVSSNSQEKNIIPNKAELTKQTKTRGHSTSISSITSSIKNFQIL